MSSWIGVVDHPFFDVTDEQGNFSIEGLPPGEYTVATWHEVLGSAETTVTVSAETASTTAFTLPGPTD